MINSVIISVLAFIVAIGVLVTVHEFGHFWVARRLDVKVLKFSIGFGKPLWTWRIGSDRMELVIAALPLGGFVKMLDEREGDVPASEVHRAFNRKPLPTRIAVVAAGPIFNFLFAIPMIAVWPANFAIPMGPLRFSTDACPITIFHRARNVSCVISKVLASAAGTASATPYLTTTRIVSC